MSDKDIRKYPRFEAKVLVDMRSNGEEVARQHLRNLRDYIMTMQYTDGISVYIRRIPPEEKWVEVS